MHVVSNYSWYSKPCSYVLWYCAPRDLDATCHIVCQYSGTILNNITVAFSYVVTKEILSKIQNSH